MIHESNAALERPLVPDACLLDVTHAIVNHAEVEVSLLELVFENGPNLRILGRQALLLHGQQIFLNTVFVSHHGLIVVFDLHEYGCEVEICLNIKVIITQRVLINLSQLR